jgi:hypothetical protein
MRAPCFTSRQESDPPTEKTPQTQPPNHPKLKNSKTQKLKNSKTQKLKNSKTQKLKNSKTQKLPLLVQQQAMHHCPTKSLTPC